MKSINKQLSETDKNSSSSKFLKTLLVSATLSLGIIDPANATKRHEHQIAEFVKPNIDMVKLEQIVNDISVGFDKYAIKIKNGEQSESNQAGEFFELNPSSVVDFIGEEIILSAENLPGNKKQTILQISGVKVIPDKYNTTGVVVKDGQNIGESVFSQWSGIFIIIDGKPDIVHKNDVNINVLWEKAHSLFQQIPVIHNGKVELELPFMPDEEYEFRFFVKTSDSQGIIHLNKIKISDALEILKGMGVQNALYLGSGEVKEINPDNINAE